MRSKSMVKAFSFIVGVVISTPAFADYECTFTTALAKSPEKVISTETEIIYGNCSSRHGNLLQLVNEFENDTVHDTIEVSGSLVSNSACDHRAELNVKIYRKHFEYRIENTWTPLVDVLVKGSDSMTVTYDRYITTITCTLSR